VEIVAAMVLVERVTGVSKLCTENKREWMNVMTYRGYHYNWRGTASQGHAHRGIVASWDDRLSKINQRSEGFSSSRVRLTRKANLLS
jgi:hypothetical protein